MALHAQAAAHLAAAAGAPGVAAMTVREAREAMWGYLTLQRPAPPMVVEHRFVPGPSADLPIRILRPVVADGAQPAIVVLHGSGWVAANLDMVDEPARVLARDTGLPVITVGYQKAPEHPFPTPLEDCVAAVRWVVDHAAELGVDPARIALVGDSAGGNLAAATTRELTRDGVAIAAQALLYPALDARRAHPSYALFARGFGLDADDMAWFWGHYLGETDPLDARVSPLLEPDLVGLPPTFVASAENDVLRDEAEEYAERLRAAAVPVTARRYAGMIHGFWWMDGVLDGARELQCDVADFLGGALRAGSATRTARSRGDDGKRRRRAT